MSDIVWGPEIAIEDGERPSWLIDKTGELRVWSRSEDGYTDTNKLAHLAGDDGSSNWFTHGGREDGDIVAIRLPADHPYYASIADTVTIARMTIDEVYRADWADEYPALAVHICRHLGLIKPDPTPLDRFMAANPDADRATAEKALVFER